MEEPFIAQEFYKLPSVNFTWGKGERIFFHGGNSSSRQNEDEKVEEDQEDQKVS
jgi:hypothetical protein